MRSSYPDFERMTLEECVEAARSHGRRMIIQAWWSAGVLALLLLAFIFESSFLALAIFAPCYWLFRRELRAAHFMHAMAEFGTAGSEFADAIAEQNKRATAAAFAALPAAGSA